MSICAGSNSKNHRIRYFFFLLPFSEDDFELLDFDSDDFDSPELDSLDLDSPLLESPLLESEDLFSPDFSLDEESLLSLALSPGAGEPLFLA